MLKLRILACRRDMSYEIPEIWNVRRGVVAGKDTADGDGDLDEGGHHAYGVQDVLEAGEGALVGQHGEEEAIETQAHKAHRCSQVVQQHQFPAMKAPTEATQPKPRAALLRMDWQLFLSIMWAWWKMQNTRTARRGEGVKQTQHEPHTTPLRNTTRTAEERRLSHKQRIPLPPRL
ncbi:hypothetical protein JZ751_004385 [Albula glossodonta]|uniref:Uncharacterized protein n=1 Tax=Albula glossodonta TaxID=121402 RepID=A0A8T2N895_9TELE|nr:hypothetical protein JZ751_004385 [Albula glossodonta]